MDKRLELVEACRVAHQTVVEALGEDGEWIGDGRTVV